MSKQISIPGSVKIIPSGYTGNSNISGSTSSYPYSNAYNTADNTAYARLTPTRNTTWTIYFTFASPSPAIPSNATITGITARFKAAPSDTTRITAATAQLSVGTTTKGSSTSFQSSTTASVRTIDAGSISNWSISDFSSLRLKLTGTRNNTNTSTYIYFYGADVTIDYTVNGIAYEITASTSDNGGTVSPASADILAGENCSIHLEPNTTGIAPYKVLDNNVDVTNQVVESQGEASSYTVTKASGASYEFIQSGNSWVSNNTGKSSSAAVSIITLTIKNNAAVTINAVASSEASYDYGYLSNIGSTFSTSAGNESSYKWRGAGSDSATVDYGTLTPGTYQIYAKYYKDQYTDSGSDNFTFTVNISETVPPGTGFVYNLTNVQADHNIVVQFNPSTTYNITGTVATGLSISPSLPQTIYEGRDCTFTITPTAAGTIIVNDNGTTTRYIIPRTNIHSVEYSITDIAANHTLAITFEAQQQYQISGTAASGLTLSPSLPQSAYGGEDFDLTITPSAGGKITVNDNGTDYIYTVSRTNVQPVHHYISSVAEAHVLAITFEAAAQYTISGTVGSGVSISPSLPQTKYTGDNLALTLTPSEAGIITVVDNNKTTTYQIVAGQVAAVIYNINGITESHTLNITFEALPQYTISVGPNGIASGVTVSPSLPVTKYLGESQTFTITPSTSGTITILEDNVEKAIHYIIPGEVNPVTYSITNIAANHTLEVKYSVLPQFTATASLTGTGNLSDTSITEYAGNKLTFTITGVPTSNIIIATQDGKNVSADVEQSGTTYTYTFPLVNDTNITFTSKVPQNVNVEATIDQFGSVDPESTTVLEGDTYTLVITPDDYQTNPPTKPLSVSDNYVEVVDQLELKQDTASPTLTANNSSYSSLNSSNQSLWANARNKTAENPSTTSTTSNSYSSGQNTTGTITYTFDFSSIPANATIKSVSCRAYGHCENTTQDSTHFCRIQLYKNGTAVGSYGQYSSTSNSIKEVPDCGTWTRSELDTLSFRVTVGYYGGMIYGISLVIEYEIDAWRYYYTVPIYEAKTISVKYKPDFYVKVNNQWKGRALTAMLPKINGKYVSVKKMFVKINGVWKSVD